MSLCYLSDFEMCLLLLLLLLLFVKDCHEFLGGIININIATVQCESTPPLKFSDIFSQTVGNL